MPIPTTVWLVPAGSIRSTRGRIEAQSDGVVFIPDGGEGDQVRFSRGLVRRARRLRGSAVLEVAHVDHGLERTVLLYFTEPPPLARDERRSPFNPMRGVERTAAAIGLRRAAKAKRQQVEDWARALRE